MGFNIFFNLFFCVGTNCIVTGEVMIGRKRSTQSNAAPPEEKEDSNSSPYSPPSAPLSNKTKLSSANRSAPLFSSIATSIATSAPKLKPTGINLFGSISSSTHSTTNGQTPTKHPPLSESDSSVDTSTDATLSPPPRNSLNASAPGSLSSPPTAKPTRGNSPTPTISTPTTSPIPTISPPTTPTTPHSTLFTPAPTPGSPGLTAPNTESEASQKFETVAQDTLWSHTAAVAKTRFSGLGSKMACSGVDGVVKIWSTDSTARITTVSYDLSYALASLVYQYILFCGSSIVRVGNKNKQVGKLFIFVFQSCDLCQTVTLWHNRR
jgi:hypothetical protein